MARFRESYNSFNAPSWELWNPSNMITSAGVSNTVKSVSGFVSSVSLESTGLMQKDLISAASASVTVPEIT